MKHERDKEVILNSMFGYATHKGISPNKYFKDVSKIHTSKDIIKLEAKQSKNVDEVSPTSIWKPNT